nr:MAG TPA: hypothetical protein [Caudoviricetes sp.]
MLSAIASGLLLEAILIINALNDSSPPNTSNISSEELY